MQLNPDSWHYRLANNYGGGCFWRRTDLCTYLRCLLLGALLCCALTAGGAVISAVMLSPLLSVVAWLIEGYWMGLDEVQLVAIGAWIGLCIFAGIMVYVSRGGVRGRLLPRLPKPLREAYRGWKEKYCPIVEFEQTEQL